MHKKNSNNPTSSIPIEPLPVQDGDVKRESADIIETDAMPEKHNLNSFFHSFVSSKPVMILPHVFASWEYHTAILLPYPITPFVLADHLGGNENKAERILKYALTAEGTNLYNLFSVQPRNFRYSVMNKSNDGRKIVRASDNVDASFYMVGRVTHCSLENGEYNKEINIQPLGSPSTPIVYKDGLTISSYQKPMEGQKEPKVSTGANEWSDVHKVPMFLGHSKFALTHYPALPLADIKFGDYATVKTAQAPFDSFYEDFGDETPLGVDDTHVMERYSGDITDIPVSVLPSGPVIKCAIRYKIPSTQSPPTYAGPDSDPPKCLIHKDVLYYCEPLKAVLTCYLNYKLNRDIQMNTSTEK
ncbi:uncharacterized protein EV420DRAFT_1487401 [Desarmillaria tabescens]|uniref:Uncharacterized protein n=1 Tax=Armillaria tabescens TaxID=1929756 RepID=A0AA39MKK8_ARMTA|nr:uncharacterized protein EV420DRAFT_1487401 [Desarmillaria tabescens]KAK0436850.1 hypothetical protein EV420DRAFT_1487401 [Desarmillaria tabescens]